MPNMPPTFELQRCQQVPRKQFSNKAETQRCAVQGTNSQGAETLGGCSTIWGLVP